MAAISAFTFTVSSGSDGATVTTSNSTADAVSGTPQVDTDWHIVNDRSARFTTSSGTETVGLYAGSTLTTAYMAGPVRLWSRPSVSNVVIVNLTTNAGAVCGQIQWLTNGTFRLRNQSQSAVGTVSSAVLVDGEDGSTGEYWVTLQITGSTWRARIYRLGTSDLVWDSGSLSYSGGAFQRVSLGIGTSGATADLSVDSWSADDASMPSQPTTAPTVDAGADKSADVATKVSIDATISGGSGTQAWTHVSGPTVTIASPSAVDTDVTNTGGPGDTVLRLTDGVSSDTMVIHWGALPTTAGVQGIESAGDWTDTANLLDDDVETVATITDASSDALGLRMKNRTTPTGDINIKLRGLAQTGTHTFAWSLRKHDKSTVVKSGTGVSVSGDTVTISVDSADIAAMGTDWAHEDGWGSYLVLTASAV